MGASNPATIFQHNSSQSISGIKDTGQIITTWPLWAKSLTTLPHSSMISTCTLSFILWKCPTSPGITSHLVSMDRGNQTVVYCCEILDYKSFKTEFCIHSQTECRKIWNWISAGKIL